MKKETSPTPFDQRLFLIFIVTFASMTVFEFAAQFLYPYAPDWRSNLITSLFTSGLAVIIAYFPLNNYYTTTTNLSSEVKRRHEVEKELRERERAGCGEPLTSHLWERESFHRISGLPGKCCPMHYNRIHPGRNSFPIAHFNTCARRNKSDCHLCRNPQKRRCGGR